MSAKSHAAVLAALVAAAPLAAQMTPGRPLMIGVYGGGYDHFLNLNAAGTTSFTPGYSIGATAGVQLNRYVAVHADFTLHGCDAAGTASFAGRNFGMLFYGAHVQVGYPLSGGVTPYAFLGGGAVTIHEFGGVTTVSPFTKPAAMFGAGFLYALPRTPVELFAEAKGHVYKWDRGVSIQTQWSIMSTGGQPYVVALDAVQLDHMQWDFIYAAGLSYRFAW